MLSKLPLTTKAEFDSAVRAAAEAFPKWRNTPTPARVRVMFKFQELIRANMVRALGGRARGRGLVAPVGHVGGLAGPWRAVCGYGGRGELQFCWSTLSTGEGSGLGKRLQHRTPGLHSWKTAMGREIRAATGDLYNVCTAMASNPYHICGDACVDDTSGS